MNKYTFTYNKFCRLFQFKNWIILCFVLLIGIKPISDITSFFSETKFEISNYISLENQQGKEIESINDDDCEKFFNLTIFNTFDNLDQLIIYFDIHNNVINVDSDIHLPPPRNNNYF